MDISQRGEILSLLIFITFFYMIIKRLVYPTIKFCHHLLIHVLPCVHSCSNFCLRCSFPHQAL